MILEVLLVIVVAAVIVTLGLRAYHHQHENLLTKLVRNDIKSIRSALNAYYMQQACDQSGKLDVATGVDIIDQLNVIAQRQPIVAAYHASIIDMDATTISDKPVYQLAVSLTLAPLKQQEINWLAEKLDGRVHQQQIFWEALPGQHMLANYPALLASLNTSREQFLNFTNAKAGVELTHAHANCFR